MSNSMPNQLWHHSFTYFAGLAALSTVQHVTSRVAKKFVFQLERAPTSGRLHYQGYVNLKSKQRPKELAAKMSGLGMKGVTVLPSSNDGKEALKAYCMKSATRVEGPWADKPIYLGQDLIKELRPWQQHIMDMTSKTPDPRAIHWYYDSKGGHGKTSISKYLFFHHKILTLTIGKASDLLNLVSKFQGRKMYIFDISRTTTAGVMTEMYAAIEAVKNGFFVNTKYDTSVVCMAIPHIVVFSNFLPKMSALSTDRWRIHDLDNI